MRKFVAAGVAFLGMLFLGTTSHGQVVSTNTVGYVNQPWYPGYNLISNPFDRGTNTLSVLFAGAPNGTTVSLWDTLANAYTEASAMVNGEWTTDLELWVGRGAVINSPIPFTNIYVGNVVLTPGSGPDGPFLPPPVFSGPDGIHLLGSVMPLLLGGASEFAVFDYVVGRGPQVGEQFTRLDPLTQTLATTTYLGGDMWDNGVPELNVAESAFFNLGPGDGVAFVPEPGALTLLGLGSLTLVMRRKRR